MAFLTLMAAWVATIISPGPDFLAVLRASASGGREKGLATGAGVVGGIACWATLAITGLSLLLARHANLYLVIRWVGALFLAGYGLHILWSLWTSRAARADGRTGAADALAGPSVGGPWSCFRTGVATNLANPKAVLFFGALFASVLPPHLSAASKVGVVVAMLVVALAWFSLVAVLAGSQAVMTRYRRAQCRLDATAGGLFVIVGAALVPR